MSIREEIYERFQSGVLENKTVSEICKILNIPYREKNRLIPLLDELVSEGKLFKNDGGRYGTIEGLGLIKGVLSGHERGFAFLVPEDKEKYENDFFIPHKSLHGALHGDTVLAERTYGDKGDEANVVAILDRGFKQIVGTFRRDKRAGYLYPDEKKFSTEIYIPISDCFNVPNGVKAVAKITSYPYGKSPGGEIIEILGEEDDFFAEELSIIRSYNLREEFPPHVEKEAKKQQNRGITPADLENRRDFRDKLIVTIDGEDTRDIDDAVSLETLRHIGRGNGHIPYHKVLLAIQGAEHQVSEGVEGNASGQPTLVEAAMELAGYEAQQQGGKCKDGLGHTDAEEKDEEGAHHVHGVRTRLEPAKDGYHAQQEDKGGLPIDAAHPFVGALADVGAVDVPVGQRHQGEEEEEQL